MKSKNLQGTWNEITGIVAHDIAFNAAGAMAIIGPVDNQTPEQGNHVWIKNTPNSNWAKQPLIGNSLSLDVDGTPWTTYFGHFDSNGQYSCGGPIVRGDKLIAGEGWDISVGANGEIFLVGTHEPQAGDRVWQFIKGVFQQPLSIPGKDAWRIAVAPDGNPWVVCTDGSIYRLENNSWRQLPGGARDIGIGADGSVWIVGSGNITSQVDMYLWDESQMTWATKISPPPYAEFFKVAVDPNGVPYAVHWPTRLQWEQSIPVTPNFFNGTMFYYK